MNGSKLNLTVKEKKRNAKIFFKIVEAIILPVLIGILMGAGHFVTILISIIWLGTGIYGLFINWEDFIFQILLRFLGIIE